MRRLSTITLSTMLILLLLGGTAWAHGGQYRGPGGAVPPDMREPEDPTPPPPPPGTGAPVTEPPNTPTPGNQPQPTTPDGPSGPAQPTTPNLGGSGRGGGRSTIGMDHWMFWYEMNKARIQNLKEAIYTRVGSTNPIFTMGQGGHTNRTAMTLPTRARIATDVIPALLWTIDPKNFDHQDIESAAYIALAKVSQDPTHIELIQNGLNSNHPITQESAALALGLLRRARKEDQFSAHDLDRVRSFLFAAFENDELRTRARGFAALAIGMLGDQPSGSEPHSGPEATTEHLFQLMDRSYVAPDLPIALLLAGSLQSATSVTEAHRQVLRQCVSRSRLGRHQVPAFVAQYAALALGRVGDRDKDLHFLQRALTTRHGSSRNVQRSAAIALGELGRKTGAEDRVTIATTILTAVRQRKLSDRSARNFATISLAYLVQADVEAGRTDVLGRTKVGEFLLTEAERGRGSSQAFGALALGLVCRAIGDQTGVTLYGDFQSSAREVLRNGLFSSRVDPRDRASFAVSLGMAHDERCVKDLTALLSDPKLSHELRGYAALGLGHIGIHSREVLVAIRKALKSRTSEQLRRATATALGMLRDREAVPLLLDELRVARSQSVKGEVVMALARVGDERAILPLVKLLKDGGERALTRALACSGLGIVGDLEWIPSLSLLSQDLNYRAAGSMMAEALSIL